MLKQLDIYAQNKKKSRPEFIPITKNPFKLIIELNIICKIIKLPEFNVIENLYDLDFGGDF